MTPDLHPDLDLDLDLDLDPGALALAPAADRRLVASARRYALATIAITTALAVARLELSDCCAHSRAPAAAAVGVAMERTRG